MSRYLYHYTTPDRVHLICEKGKGLQSGQPTCSYQLDEEGEPFDDFDFEVSEAQAEEDLNHLLESYKPAKFKKYSREGVYMWTQPKFYNDRCEVVIDASKLDSSKAYVADSELTDRVYDMLLAGQIDANLDGDPEYVEVAKSFLKDYWKSAKPYKKGEEYGSYYEVVYNDVIPPEAIKAVEGCEVENIGAQTLLTTYMNPIERAQLTQKRIEL